MTCDIHLNNLPPKTVCYGKCLGSSFFVSILLDFEIECSIKLISNLKKNHILSHNFLNLIYIFQNGTFSHGES